MNEWKAKYKALLIGIDNEEYIRNAEKLVETAYKLSTASPYTFEQTMYALMDVVRHQTGEKTMKSLMILADCDIFADIAIVNDALKTFKRLTCGDHRGSMDDKHTLAQEALEALERIEQRIDLQS